MHNPVMLNEALEALGIESGSRIIDATLGGAGHAEAILRQLGCGGVLLGLDRDSDAIERARAKLDGSPARLLLKQADFAEIANVAAEFGLDEVDGVLMDLGISSFQLDDPARGFSFQRSGPLDMRMNADTGLSAADIVNDCEEEGLAEIFWRYGEERDSRRIAKAIVEKRRLKAIEDTDRLAEIVSEAKGGRRGKRHPATKVFMALRIAVNDELSSLERGLEEALTTLAVGGRLVVITFHSLEDRIVKNCFKRHAGRQESLQAGGSRWIGTDPSVELIGKKPILPREEELTANARARSAKMRVAEIKRR